MGRSFLLDRSMRVLRGLSVLALALSLGGCGFVHFGRLPTPDDTSLQNAYVDLGIQQKILKQELVLARKEEDALRDALDHAVAPATGAAPNLSLQLETTTRELATLRANYAKLQAEIASPAPAADPRVPELEANLKSESATAAQLQEQNTQLQRELAVAQTQNAQLAQQLKLSLAEAKQSHDTITRLGTDMEAEREARAHAEEATRALRVQLDAVMARATAAAAVPPPVSTAPSNSALAALAQAKAPPSGSVPMALVELHSKGPQPVNGPNEPRPGEHSPTNSPAPPPANITVGSPTPATTTQPSPAPSLPASAPGSRTYTVQAGDTLEKIAVREYGAADQWTKIYEANAGLLSANQGLKPGMTLQIPAKD